MGITIKPDQLSAAFSRAREAVSGMNEAGGGGLHLLRLQNAWAGPSPRVFQKYLVR